MASQFVRKITDTTTSEPIKETTTSGDLIITKDDKVLINLNGTLKDLTAGKDAEMPVVGGRNYIPNSQKAGFRANTNVIQSVTVEKFDDTTSMLHLVNPAGGSINSGVYIPQTVIKTGDKWAFSMDIKGTGVYNRVGINNSSMTVAPSGNVKADWTRVVSSGVASKDNDFVVVIYFNTKDTALDVYIKLPKLEAGNVATDWTPAPEDIPSDIVTANTAIKKNADDIKTANTNIKKNTDDITQLKADIEALKPTE